MPPRPAFGTQTSTICAGGDWKWKYDTSTKCGRFSPVSVGEEGEEDDDDDEWAGPRLIQNTFSRERI